MILQVVDGRERWTWSFGLDQERPGCRSGGKERSYATFMTF